VTGLRLPPQTPALQRLGLGRDVTARGARHRSRRARRATTGRALVSCIMPTTGRLPFALNAVRLFAAQDHPDRELVVVTDRGADDVLEATLTTDPRIRLVAAPPGASIGHKRNLACRAARGEVIAHWDDDDWYAPARLSAQLAPLRAGRADVTGLTTPVIFELPEWRFWAVTPALHRQLFVGDVHGGTLVYRREVWEHLARYPDASLAEDACFLRIALRRGARLERVAGDGLFMYVRHGRNAWRLGVGEHGARAGWRRAGEPPLAPADRDFYRARRASAAAPRCATAPPLVSCIMPTANRAPLVARAIAYFLRQDYHRRELLILDDGDDAVDALVPADPRIRYVRLAARLPLGEKRNRGCELARGAVIAHWDDDDWYAPTRLSEQVRHLRRAGADVCGPGRLLCFDPARALAWRYQHAAPWVAGSGLCYRRAAWRDTPFAGIDVGEDTRFVYDRPAGGVLVLRDERLLAGLVHPANTSPKRTSGPGWRQRPLAEIRALLGADYRLYESPARPAQATTPSAPKPVAAATNAP
jgi:glycosyltransferase involved in cell wall biosynthesis